MTHGTWTEAHFESMSWHDNHVHALRIVEGAYGAGQLVLDVDYIVEWRCNADNGRFRIVPAELTFNEVTHLRIAIDYASQTAGLVPFSIEAIDRQFEQRERYVAQCWTIRLNWPRGEIAFEAAGFEQRALGQAVLTDAMYLQPDQRRPGV